MFFGAATAVLLWGVTSIFVVLLGCATTYMFQGEKLAIELFNSYVFNFNGILVVAFAYGTYMFVRRYGNLVLNTILNVTQLSDDVAVRVARNHYHAMSFARQNRIAWPVLIVGGWTLWSAGYPLEGFAKYFLAVTSISLYYVGGLLFAYAIYTMRLFREIDREYPKATTSGRVSRTELDALNTYFSVVSTLAIVSFYLAFRGTLTANFTFSTEHPELTRKILVFPAIVFPWFLFIIGLYPKITAKKLADGALLGRIERVETRLSELYQENLPMTELVEIEKSLLEIRSRYVLEKSKVSALSIKDSPSLIVASLSAIHFIIQNDDVVTKFFSSL